MAGKREGTEDENNFFIISCPFSLHFKWKEVKEVSVKWKGGIILHFLVMNEAQTIKHKQSNCSELKFEKCDMTW